jgi:hypothetical protein
VAAQAKRTTKMNETEGAARCASGLGGRILAKMQAKRRTKMSDFREKAEDVVDELHCDWFSKEDGVETIRAALKEAEERGARKADKELLEMVRELQHMGCVGEIHNTSCEKAQALLSKIDGK